jgi:hypothetical protein
MAPLADDAARLAPITAEVRAFVAGLDEPLRGLCAPFVEELLAGEFTLIAALLPAWLCDLLPVREETARRLGAAQLFGWWYGAARDAALDGAAPPAVILGGGLALLRALAIYAELGAPALPLAEALERRAALAYAHELAGRPGASALTPAHLAHWSGDLAGERAAGMRLALLAQAALAGLAPGDPRLAAAEEALACLIAARQIGDDAADWREDLRAGQLNGVSAALARHLLAGEPDAPLGAERLAARHLAAEPFWERLWAEHAALCARGRAALAPFGPTRLAGLLAVEAERGEEAARAGVAWRAGVRAALGLR